MATLLVAVAAACSSSTGTDASAGPTLETTRDDGSDVQSTFQDVALGTSLIVPMRTLCTTGKLITITRVTAWDPTGGMRVTSWGTRYVGPTTDDGPNKGGIAGPVDRVQGFGHHRVEVNCRNTSIAEANQFSVSVAATAKRATMRGVTIYYAHGRQLKAQYAVAMCSTHTCKDSAP